jgi:hypothetical protein
MRCTPVCAFIQVSLNAYICLNPKIDETLKKLRIFLAQRNKNVEETLTSNVQLFLKKKWVSAAAVIQGDSEQGVQRVSQADVRASLDTASI